MPINPNLLAGLSNATVPTVVGANQPASGYKIAPASNAEDRIASKVISKMNSPLVYSFPRDLPKYHFVLIENSWEANNGFVLSPRKMFKLQLPTPLTDSFEVDYDQNFNYLGQVSDAVSRITRGVSDIAQAALGLKLNTFRTVTMTSPKYRTFDFTWKFAPKNFEEALEIRRITFALRKGMAPQRGLEKLVLQFPWIYTMYFTPNTQYLYKFKPCVLAACNIDYQGGNPFPGFYKAIDNQPGEGTNAELQQHSPPESVTMSTRWIELEYWLNSDTDDVGENTDFDSIGDIPTNDPFDSWNYYKRTY